MWYLKSIAVVATVSTGLIAGFFYAWVCSTMWGLDQLEPQTAIKAMNAMNASVRNAVFFPTFFLTPVLLMVASVGCFLHRSTGPAIMFALAAIIYFGFAFVPTALVNVPMNNELAALSSAEVTANAGDIWASYSSHWQFWNIERTLASIIALMLAIIGCIKLPIRQTS